MINLASTVILGLLRNKSLKQKKKIELDVSDSLVVNEQIMLLNLDPILYRQDETGGFV